MLHILHKESDITLKLSLGERKLIEFLSKSSGQNKKNKQENYEKSIIFLNHHLVLTQCFEDCHF